MFSRAGKSSTDKFRILLEKEAILKEKFRVKYPEKKNFENKNLAVDEINKVASQELFKIDSQKKEDFKKMKNFQRSHSGNYLFKVQSRNDYYESNSVKNHAPPPGTYSLAGLQNTQHVQSPLFKDHSKHEENFQSASYFKPVSPRRAIIRPKSIIPYNKQIKRKSNRTNLNDLSYDPSFSLVEKKVNQVDMKKDLPRKKNLFSLPLEATDYEPNKDYVMTDLGKVLNFGLMEKRKPLFNIVQAPEPYDVNLTATHPKTHSLDFNKQMKLEIDPRLPLPSFMQTIHNRTSVLYPSFKTLNLG